MRRIAMRTGAWLIRVCALWLAAAAHAHVFTRCELAHRLQHTPMREHLALWVCIAQHESQFDTAAYNAGSYDHGLFQISEIYWCNRGGEGCGVPCERLRDDDISDDVECALQVHEEHTRLSGDGFSAWTVYNRGDCKNAKKLLIDCDMQEKSASKAYEKFNTSKLYSQIDELKPPYLTVKQIVRQQNIPRQKNPRTNWFDFKVDNIDELKLPVFQKPSPAAPSSTTMTAPIITTTTPRTALDTQETHPFRITLTTDPPTPQLPSTTPPSVPSTTASTNVITTTTTTVQDFKPRQFRIRIANLIPAPTSAAKPAVSVRNFSFRSPKQNSAPFTFNYRRPADITTSAATPAVGPVVTAGRRTSVIRKHDDRFRFIHRNEPSRVSTTEPTTTATSVSKGSNSPFGFSYQKLATRVSVPTVIGSKSVGRDIFDLYLSTMRPTLTTYNFAPIRSGGKLSIFAGGSTTPLPALGARAARNQLRRHAP